MTSPSLSPLPEDRSVLLHTVQVQVLDTPALRLRAQELLAAQHYLGGVQAVGEQVHYAVSDAQGEWVAVLIFAAAALHLRARDTWIGWSDEQRRRRLAMVVNNVRFLLLPERAVPNLGSVVLSRVLARLNDDWQERYGHPVLIVETFVDPGRAHAVPTTRSGRSAGQPRCIAYPGADGPRGGARPRRRLPADGQRQSARHAGGGAGAGTRSRLPPFAPLKDPAAIRWTDLKKGRVVTRTLVARELEGETAGFPLVAQVARVQRQREGRAPETVELITSRPKPALSLAQWLEANINHWGIETGLHARQDASRQDDRCRLRRPHAVWIHGMFNRWANSLFMHWSRHQPNARYRITSDFISHRSANHDRRAISALLSKYFPS